MDELKIEQVGGFVGYGGAHLKSEGTVRLSALSSHDRDIVNRLFQRSSDLRASGPHTADQFRYRLTRNTAGGVETIEAAESEVPDSVRQSVATRLE